MSAIRPDKFVTPYQRIVEEKAVEKGSSQDEIMLNDISHSNGWQVLTTEMDLVISELEGSLAAQMEAGATFEDIGKTAVVKEIVKSYITRLRNKVDDARSAVSGDN